MDIARTTFSVNLIYGIIIYGEESYFSRNSKHLTDKK